MIKIYFDQNVITEFKDEQKELFNFCLDNSCFFVFPYSIAHIEDMLNSDESHPDFKKDMKILDELCADHLIDSELTNTPHPYICKPSDYYQTEKKKRNSLIYRLQSIIGDTLSKLQSIVYSKQQGSCDSAPNLFGDNFQNLDRVTAIVNNPFLKINPKELNYIAKTSMNKDKKSTKAYKSIAMHNSPLTLFQHLDKICTAQSKQKFSELIHKKLEESGVNNPQKEFKATFLLLETVGYKVDRKSSFDNIIADNDHTYNAKICDVFVTNDTRLQNRAKAMYQREYHRVNVIGSEGLIDVLKNEIERAFDLKYLRDTALPKYGKPDRYLNENDAVYKQLPYRPFAFFNYCVDITDSVGELINHNFSTKVVWLMNYIEPGYVMFKSEYDKYFDILKALMPNQSDKDNFQKEYCDKFLSRNKEITLTAEFNPSLIP